VNWLQRHPGVVQRSLPPLDSCAWNGHPQKQRVAAVARAQGTVLLPMSRIWHALQDHTAVSRTTGGSAASGLE